MSGNTSIAYRQLIDIALGQIISDLYTNYFVFEKLCRAVSFLLSFLVLYLFYEYVEYVVILDAYKYERAMRKRYGFIRRMRYKLEQLSREYGNFYFYYLPMNHGLKAPPTYTLFQAVKEILNKNDRPACRRLCMSILMELAQCDYDTDCGLIAHDVEENRRKLGFGDIDNAESEPLTDFDLNVMQFTREMVFFGVKDVETMATLHHLVEAVFGDS